MKSLSIYQEHHPQPLTRSLESERPPVTPWFALAITQDALRFTVGCESPPHNPLAMAAPGTFTPDLWRHDVGELFLKHASNETYLEINLGPWGAWWACRFQAHRQPAEEKPSRPFIPTALSDKTSPSSWQTALTIPLTYLQDHYAFGPDSCANVCFILGPSEARHHFSAAPLAHDPPDFHQVADFLPVALSQVGP